MSFDLPPRPVQRTEGDPQSFRLPPRWSPQGVLIVRMCREETSPRQFADKHIVCILRLQLPEGKRDPRKYWFNHHYRLFLESSTSGEQYAHRRQNEKFTATFAVLYVIQIQ